MELWIVGGVGMIEELISAVLNSVLCHLNAPLH